MLRKQQQRDGETQLQAGRDLIQNVSVGLGYKDAVEIFDSRAALLRDELTVEARAIADERLEVLETKLLEAISKAGFLGAFADPDFQFNILEAQRSAARTDQPEDIDVLVDLLVQRVATPGTPRLRVATRKALDVVGQLSEESLAALTALWYGLRLFPENFPMPAFLSAVDSHVQTFVGKLPLDRRWLSDLGVLDCVQLGIGVGQLKSFPQLLGESKCTGFVCRGMDEETANRRREELYIAAKASAKVFIAPNAFDTLLIVPHALDDDRFALIGSSERSFRKAIEPLLRQFPGAEFSAVIESVIADNHYEERCPNWLAKLKAKTREYRSLLAIDDWWHDLPALEVTAVGVALGYANLRRLLPGQFGLSLEQCL